MTDFANVRKRQRPPGRAPRQGGRRALACRGTDSQDDFRAAAQGGVRFNPAHCVEIRASIAHISMRENFSKTPPSLANMLSREFPAVALPDAQQIVLACTEIREKALFALRILSTNQGVGFFPKGLFSRRKESFVNTHCEMSLAKCRRRRRRARKRSIST